MNKWTEEENKFLEQNYLKIPTAAIAKCLNKTVGAVSRHAQYLFYSQPNKYYKRISYKYVLTSQGQIKAQILMVVIDNLRKESIELNITPNLDLKAIRQAIKSIKKVVLI